MGSWIVDYLRLEIASTECLGLKFHVTVQVVDGDFVLIGHQPDFGTYMNDRLIALPEVIIAILFQHEIGGLEVVRSSI